MYSGRNYSGLFFTMASTQACLHINGDVRSYVNNLPVQVRMYRWSTSGYWEEATVRAGGFSSDTGNHPFWDRPCTGGVAP
ncbi:peptidase inhibitor family I36 protein [Streptomyces sp. NPDC015346]|uniref:peptidase inhibitor family I36 protein n=1 Tax=Streptomyces sp. NPDC015346 TaxID=3364954 RepID=UPI0036F8BE2C